jgi:DNA-binding NarL/FixJ family response regulator
MNPAVTRALIVEDDRSWQQILTELLTDAGLTVDLASNLQDALQRVKEAPHRLAIVDLSLAESDHRSRDGLRVLEAVRRQDPACRTVLLTGFATVELAVSVLTEYGAFTFLRKENFQRARFRELVNRILMTAPPTVAGRPGLSDAGQATGRESGRVALSAPPNRALIVDDDAGWRSILSELLEDTGYQVRLCNSFGEAIGCLRREKYNIAVVDLSLTGSELPGPSGPEAALEGYQLLSATKAADIPTIVVSGIASVDDIQRAYDQQSIFAYLEKQTFDRAAFRRAAEEAHKSRFVVNELQLLTDREREVLALLAGGMTNKEIAETLVITTNTVKRHLKAVFEKLDIHTRSAAAAKAINAGIGTGQPLPDIADLD